MNQKQCKRCGNYVSRNNINNGICLRCEDEITETQSRRKHQQLVAEKDVAIRANMRDAQRLQVRAAEASIDAANFAKDVTYLRSANSEERFLRFLKIQFGGSAANVLEEESNSILLNFDGQDGDGSFGNRIEDLIYESTPEGVVDGWIVGINKWVISSLQEPLQNLPRRNIVKLIMERKSGIRNIFSRKPAKHDVAQIIKAAEEISDKLGSLIETLKRRDAVLTSAMTLRKSFFEKLSRIPITEFTCAIEQKIKEFQCENFPKACWIEDDWWISSGQKMISDMLSGEDYTNQNMSTLNEYIAEIYGIFDSHAEMANTLIRINESNTDPVQKSYIITLPNGDSQERYIVFGKIVDPDALNGILETPECLEDPRGMYTANLLWDGLYPLRSVKSGELIRMNSDEECVIAWGISKEHGNQYANWCINGYPRNASSWSLDRIIECKGLYKFKNTHERDSWIRENNHLILTVVPDAN